MSRSQLPESCRDCPLFDEAHVRGWGVGESPLILGEAPGYQEVKKGQPFIGQSGQLLRETLRQSGVDPDEVYITNSVLCHPPGNETPNLEMIGLCEPRLAQEVALVKPTKILCVGGIALTAALRATKALPITKWRGRGFWSEWGGRQIYTVATYHPAAVLRTPDLFRDLARDIQKWAANDAPIAPPRLHQVVCETKLQVEDALATLIKAASEGYAILSCDLETTGFSPLTSEIISLGLGCEVVNKRRQSPDGITVVIPGWMLKSRQVQIPVHDLLTGASFKGTLGFHNMKFDLQFLDVLFNEHVRPPHVLDSMLLSYLLDERPVGGMFQVHGLKAQARIRYDAADYDFDFNKYEKLSQDEKTASLGQMYDYQALDLYYTAKLCRELADEVRDESTKLMNVHHQLLTTASFAFTEI